MKTKIILAGILLLLCGGSFAQRIVEYGDLRTLTDAEHGTGVYYLKDGKRPLSGEYRILRGQDEESVHFFKGVKQGEYRRYRDGVLREKGAYADGKRHGLFVTYYQDGKTPQREAPMQHGKIEGTVRTWFADGKPDMIQEYREGKKNGKEQRFAPKTGRLIYEVSYIDDQKEGKQWELNEDETEGWRSETVSQYTAHEHGKLYLHESGTYKAGYKHGVWKKTDDDGIVTQGEYTDGRETGHWVRYDSTNGEILNEWDK